ncbi:MAG: DUF937 domain-containing protein [Gammaproteobacteria bacterium]|nr:DUF937 domain-containing protein [Gammaproteobacteria bacterium]NND60166.1 DUF937 domain-containing protein [Gammaproteobacteria bacterium]
MDLLKTLLEAQGGGLVQQVANQVGLDREQANSAVAELLPKLASGMKSNIARPGGLESLLGAVQSGDHQRYIDNPAELNTEEGIQEGQGILGHLLGGDDVREAVTTHAAQRTGIDADKLQSMLPMIASMMMGSVSKQVSGGGLSQQPGLGQAAAALQNLGGDNPVGAILGQFLGGDNDAQADAQPAQKGGLFNLARRFFK